MLICQLLAAGVAGVAGWTGWGSRVFCPSWLGAAAMRGGLASLARGTVASFCGATGLTAAAVAGGLTAEHHAIGSAKN